MTRFDIVQPRVLRHEGGYVNHPRDPGGATNKGVTQRVYDSFRTRNSQTRRSVREIIPSEIDTIYRRQYWDAVKAGQLPAGVDYCTYDAAVNSGPSRAAKWLQRAVGVQADGVVGEVTLAAVARTNASTIINRMCDDRMAFLRRLRHWPTFRRGWTTRVSDVRRHAIADVDLVPVNADAVSYIPDGGMAKAPDETLRPSHAPELTAGGLAAIGTAIAPIAVPAITASGASPVLQYAIAGVIVAIAVIAGVWFVRRYLRRADMERTS